MRTAAVLSGVGSELRSLAIIIEELEELIANLVVAGAFAGSPSVYKLQALDKVCQTLEGLADFIDALKDLVPECQIDVELAGRLIKISDLSRRLSGECSEDAGEINDGQCEVFDAVA